MNSVQSEAIILSTRDYGESDRLINFFTGTKGRLRGIAKGARRSRERFVNSFEPCSVVDLSYRERRGRIWIESSKLLEPFLALRNDLERWGYSALATELVLEMAPEGEPNPELFPLLKGMYGRLSEDKDPMNGFLLFLFRFLDLMGYLPALDGCSLCRKPLSEATRWWWGVSRGVVACPEHRSFERGDISLDLGTMILIQRSRRLPLERIWRLCFSRDKRASLLEGLMAWVCGQIQKDLKSLKMLRQLKAS